MKNNRVHTAILIILLFSFLFVIDVRSSEKDVKRIVIDPGFGGNKIGAVGCDKGVYAKDINLAISNKLLKKLNETLNVEVFMTRNSDEFVALKERVELANIKSADIFLSIHTNAAEDSRAYGIETYFSSLSSADEAGNVSVTDSMSSQENINKLQSVLIDLAQTNKKSDSMLLAHYVQKALYDHLNVKYSTIKDRGVKQALFYTLVVAEMPAITVQPSFISNPRECNRLLTEEYQNDISEGIAKGIEKYIEGRKAE